MKGIFIVFLLFVLAFVFYVLAEQDLQIDAFRLKSMAPCCRLNGDKLANSFK